VESKKFNLIILKHLDMKKIVNSDFIPTYWSELNSASAHNVVIIEKTECSVNSNEIYKNGFPCDMLIVDNYTKCNSCGLHLNLLEIVSHIIHDSEETSFRKLVHFFDLVITKEELLEAFMEGYNE